MKKSKKITLLAVAFVAIVAMLLMATPAGATQPEKYAVCHANAKGGRNYGYFLGYNYIEVGNLNGHFYGGNPDRPKHGAFSFQGWNLVWHFDFVTVLGDYNCDGEKDYQPCDEVVAGEKIFSEWEPVGDPRLNDWVQTGSLGDEYNWVDLFKRTGSQLYQRTYTQEFRDARTGDLCYVEDGLQKLGKLFVEEKEEQCDWKMYVLEGRYSKCYLIPNANDVKGELPSRFDGTDYMYRLCSLYDCTPDGWELRHEFQWTGEWSTTCHEPVECDDCP